MPVVRARGVDLAVVVTVIGEDVEIAYLEMAAVVVVLTFELVMLDSVSLNCGGSDG